MMTLQEVQRYVPDFDPSSYERMPFINREMLFSPQAFPDSDIHAEAEKAGFELIRASFSERLGGKKIYTQCEALAADSRFTQTKFMWDDILSDRAVIR